MTLPKTLAAALCAISLAGLSACGNDRVQPQPRSSLSLKVESSGGFAGIQREISVSSDGILTVRDLRRKSESTIALTPAELQEIEQLTTTLPDSAPPTRPGCPDCITHVITVVREGKLRRIVVPTPSAAEEPYQSLLHRLFGLAESAARQ